MEALPPEPLREFPVHGRQSERMSDAEDELINTDMFETYDKDRRDSQQVGGAKRKAEQLIP
eukprot:9350364-Pyramimonas_sp.AAC.1